VHVRLSNSSLLDDEHLQLMLEIVGFDPPDDA
jgi:hypothetical protein